MNIQARNWTSDDQTESRVNKPSLTVTNSKHVRIFMC